VINAPNASSGIDFGKYMDKIPKYEREFGKNKVMKDINT